MRRSLLLVLLVSSIWFGAAKGGGIGAHVSAVAPEHPLDEGVLFGECVASMATMGECLHEHE